MKPGAGRGEGAGGGSVLYVTYDGLLEPLGSSQVLPYVRRLARMGFSMEILSFEKPEAEERRRRAELARVLAGEGIGWTPLRYHRRPNLPATAWDVRAGRRVARRWAARVRAEGRPALVHARGYVPGLMGLAARGPGCRLLFDMRGFWVDERIQGGYWRPSSPQARIGRWMERTLLGESDHLILLTRRGAHRLDALTPGGAPPPWTVVPTCVDTERFVPAGDAAAIRRELGLGAAPVLLHIGTLTGWYDGRLTMAVGKAFVERTGGSFVVLTRDQEAARRLAGEVGTEPLVRFVPPEEVPRWLQAADAGLALPRISDSKDASFPTKIAEYLACGLAVLATPIGDVADFEDGVSLRALRGAEDVDAAVEWLARAVGDPGRAAAARAVAVARLGVDQGAETLAGVYRELGVRPGPAPGAAAPGARPLRVLALTPYPESAPSTGFRVVQLVPALRARGVEVTLHPFVTQEEYPLVRRLGPGALLLLARAVRRLQGVVDGAGAYDAVLVQRGMALASDRRLLARLQRTGVPILFDFDDAVFLPQEGGRGWLERLRDPEATTAAFCRAAAVVLAGNEHLADFARAAVGADGEARVRVLPSVVDTERLRPRSSPTGGGPPVVGWVGSDSTVAYLETLAPALRALADRVPYRLVVVAGARRPRLEGVPYTFVPWSPSAGDETLASLDVGLYPLPDTPWSRGKCGFKALQYLACGVPCVASPVGVLRDIVRPGETGLHATDDGAWADACARLLGDPAARVRMGAAGRALVEARYSVASAAPVLAAAVAEAVEARHG